MDAQAGFVYGLTEINREAIRSATRVANPGCFATATLLGLAPLVANNLLSCRVIGRGVVTAMLALLHADAAHASASHVRGTFI